MRDLNVEIDSEAVDLTVKAVVTPNNCLTVLHVDEYTMNLTDLVKSDTRYQTLNLNDYMENNTIHGLYIKFEL